MEYPLSDFARRTEAEYAALQQFIDRCAEKGRSYELSSCALPEGCSPNRAVLGFFRIAEQYLFYIRPDICCTEDGAWLAEWIQPSSRLFGSFAGLAGFLQALGKAALQAERGTEPGLYCQLKAALGEAVLGQARAVEAVSFKMYSHICKKAPARPLSLIFYGPTGVGKSELGKAAAAALNRLQAGKEWQFVWTELNTFTEPHSVYRLTGAPPGYVGYDDPPVLEAVRRNPYTVFMFDELEKAHPSVLKVFMSILDEGRCTARKEDESGNRELDFSRCIFLFTTNADLAKKPGRSMGFAPAEQPEQEAEQGRQCENMAELAQQLFCSDEKARRALAASGVLKEIAGRFSGFVGFRPLDDAARLAITKKQIVALGREYGLRVLHVAPEIVAALMPSAVFSVRSNTGVLEGALTQIFSEYADSHAEKNVQLLGSLPKLRLTAADREMIVPALP